jgi:hypothetical protein
MTDNVILGRNSQEWSKIVRSGIAGGIAGSVVRPISLLRMGWT